MREILVLASASSARRRVLEGTGVRFVQEPSGLDEAALKATLRARAAPEIAQALALAKAEAVSARKPGMPVLGADQVLEAGGRLFDKPRDLSEARAQLVRLRGRGHRLVNGLVLVRDGRVLWRHDDAARLWMRDFDDAFLENYLAQTGPEVLESVGAYRLEGIGAQLFTRIEGDFFSILGLPLLPLLEALRREGIETLGRGHAGTVSSGRSRAETMPIGGNTKVAGVLGWPIGHSLSPSLHGFWLERHGVDGVLVPLPVRPEHLAEALRALPRLGFIGASVTVPHKQSALAHMDTVEPLARRIGAVNLIVVGADGKLTGRNTDAYGFMQSLRAGAPGWRADAGAAVVLGAGGAARAIAVALAEAGVAEIRLVNRTRARAAALAKELGLMARALPWENRAQALAGASLLVNATTLGMIGQPPLGLDLAALPATAAVMDIVYTPLETTLLVQARARGLIALDGLGMLLHQARPAFAAWFGLEPEVTAELRAHVLKGLRG